MGVDADGDQAAVGLAVAADDHERGGAGVGVEGSGLLVVEQVGADLLLDQPVGHLVGDLVGRPGGDGDCPGGLGRVGNVLLAEAHRLGMGAVAQEPGTGEAEPTVADVAAQPAAVDSSASTAVPLGRTIQVALTLAAMSAADAGSHR